MNANTRFVIDWMDRMMGKTDFCGAIFPEVLASYMGEAGADNPSDQAVSVAKEWENDLTPFFDYVRSSGKWCMSPTGGCLRYCNMWKPESVIHQVKCSN